MFCPYCGKQIPDGSKFCPMCGSPIDESDINSGEGMVVNSAPNVTPNNTSPTSINNNYTGEVVDNENFRDAPNFKKKLIMCNIIGPIGMLFGFVCLGGSLIIKFLEPLLSLGFVMFFVGMVVGIVMFSIVASMGKRLFPNQKTKLKGFLEVMPGFWLAFTIIPIVVALVIQGFYLIYV